MSNRAVGLSDAPRLRIECQFWLGDDGWKGSTEYPSISVQAGVSSRRKRRWSCIGQIH